MNHQVTTEPTNGPLGLDLRPADLPLADRRLADLPYFSLIPEVSNILPRIVIVATVLQALFLVDRLTLLLFNYWLLDSLGLSSVFFTNLRMGATLFAVAFVAFTAAVIVPAFTHRVDASARRVAIQVGLLLGLTAGYALSLNYHEFLFNNCKSFNMPDPVFGNDASFYVGVLPNLWTSCLYALACGGCALLASIIFAALVKPRHQASKRFNVLSTALSRVATTPTLVSLAIIGALSAVAYWLSRYDLLIADNERQAIFNGAQYVDVTGLLSTLNDYHLMALVALGVTAALIYTLVHVRRAVLNDAVSAWPRAATGGLTTAVCLILASFAFKAGIMIRESVAVAPNAPVIQLPYIKKHIDATLVGYNLDKVEEVRFIPKDKQDPLPDPSELLKDPAIRNAPLWPGFVNYIEQLVDPQHSDRILQTKGDEMVYGPTIEVFRQEQKLRTYYNFLRVSNLRYNIDGEKTLITSGVRELPLIEPFPWLTWWGQRFFLFTHGHGVVMAPSSQVTSEGTPVYLSSGIPTKTTKPEVTADRQGIYYGEGSSTLSFSNVREMKEFDFAKDEGRAEVVFPDDVEAGVKIDSLLKKVCIGWRSGKFFEVVFSRLIGPETRVHYYRMPTERLNNIVPFLYLDANAYAFAADGKILWMVNGLTVADRFPYSRMYDLGDKAVERARWWNRQPIRWVNYVRDSVKATVDAYTGEVKCYKISDDPIISTWADIYPDLFTEKDEMPASVRQQMQYPIHLFHTQFDDVYIEYHMKDPMTFFNMEDRWDDADEVLGPIMTEGKSLTFSVEPYQMLLNTGNGPVPASSDKVQTAMAMAFSSGSAKQLRSMPIAYQDGEDYGRLVSLQVPQAHFYLGPEQADASIDQEPEIAEQIAWWNRRGTDVIRGHTTPLLVDGEVIYVEPIFLRSQQNPITQLKKVIVVFRGKASMGDTLEEALRGAVKKAAKPSVDVAQATQ